MTSKQKLFNAALLACSLVSYVATVPGQSPTPTPAAAPGLPATVIQPKVVEDRSVRAGWRRYQFGVEPSFSVILPDAPDATAERSATAVINTYMSNQDGAVYGAVRMDGIGRDMETATESERQTFFKSYIEGFATSFQGALKKDNPNYELKLSDPKRVTAAGREAFQQDLTVGPFQASTQLVFLGSGAFGVLSVWNQQTPVADREAFFNSFQLTTKPK